MGKTTKILLTGVGITVAGATAIGAMAYASTRYLVKIALDRQQPKIPNLSRMQEQIKGSSDCEEFLDTLAEYAERLETTPHDRVQIESYDGQHLMGHWFPVPGAKRTILAMHGWRSGWSSDFGTMADFWRNNDCNVLYAEQRGQGSSGGAYMGFGMMERFDCMEWIKWLGSHTENLPLYLAGVSMGATTVLMTANLELPSNVRGIMADCGFTSAHDIWKHVTEKNLHLPYPLHSADALCREKTSMGTRDCSTVDVLKESRVPVLLAHGTVDSFVPVSMTYENYLACKSPKHLLIVPGADHGMSHFKEPERYEQETLKFFHAYDG